MILEAMACGRPIVATKVGDVERMVPEFAGLLVDDPEDDAALAELTIAALTRSWDRHRIRDHVSKQSWDTVANRVAAQWLATLKAPEVQGTRASHTARRLRSSYRREF